MAPEERGSLGPLLKRGLEIGLGLAGVPALGRWRLRGRTAVLAYHNVVPAGQPVVGDRSLHLAQDRFAAQLDQLLASHDVVPLSQAFRSVEGARPRVAITFDDAYEGALIAGIPELTARGMPATVFVCPGRLDGHAFWWDRLAAATGGVLDPELRHRALDQYAGEDETIMSALGRGALSGDHLPPHARASTVDTVLAVARAPGITLASHGWSHAALPRLEPTVAERELSDSLEWLRRYAPGSEPLLAYPYGLASESVTEAALRCGYARAFLVRGGWVRGGENPLLLPRLNIPAGLSREGFALRLAGFFNP